jgi:hypothetical protein
MFMHIMLKHNPNKIIENVFFLSKLWLFGVYLYLIYLHNYVVTNANITRLKRWIWIHS